MPTLQVPETIEECAVAGDVLRRLARCARRYKIRLILLTQGAGVKALGLEGQGDVRKNSLFLSSGPGGCQSRKRASFQSLGMGKTA